MPVEDNKQAVRRFYDDVVNGRSLDAVDELLTPDGVDGTFGSQSDVAVPARAEDADGQGFRRLVHLHSAVVAAAAQGLAVDRDPLPPRRPDRRRRPGGRWGGRRSTATAARRMRASPTSTPTAPWR
jgi:hypothetical protein